MRKNIPILLVVCAAMMSIVIAGCGSSGSQNSSTASKATLSGVASLDATANGTVAVEDSSVPAQVKTAQIGSNGRYTVDVSGLTPPFMLKTEGTDQAGESHTLYSISKNGGRTNLNPVSDTAVAASLNDTDASAHAIMKSHEYGYHRTADRFEEVIKSLRTVLAPLFELYGISGNGVTDDDDDDVEVEDEDDGEDDGEDENDNTGLRAMFHDVRFAVKDGWVTVTNRQTGGVIFKGSLKDLASGTFYPENMPGAPETGGGGTTTPPPAACVYTYSAWSACQSNNTQTRTVTSSSPAGCTGTPILSQACTDVPPTPTACTSFTYSAWGACQSNNTQTRTVTSSSPAGCTGGTPVLSQACTYVPPVQQCGSCHSIPPASGQHDFHVNSQGYACSRCHGAGYSSTAVTATTHMNGVKDVVSTLNFNATTGTCGSPGCHGSRSW